jgi:UDPglucose 6-dehydrogenase
MKIAVVGMWHLGTVTAGCLASAGHTVIGIDHDQQVIQDLRDGRVPVNEPGLKELIRKGIQMGNLRFSISPNDLTDCDIIWITYDTPVDEGDKADIAYVIERSTSLFPFFKRDVLVIISSQLPVGSVRRLEALYKENYPQGSASFACLPENLRLGKAVSIFMNPDRIIAGIRSDQDRRRIEMLFELITDKIIWMSIESAEMTKHALNAFLATSVTFINELATLCEQVGADAGDVEKGLKSESRIGPGAYLSPGASFAGGTLARDVQYLISMGQQKNLPTPLFSGVLESNQSHKLWARHRLSMILGPLKGIKVALLGLTYKAGTNTLRRSEAIEIGRWLSEQGGIPSAFDPMIQTLPENLSHMINVCPTAQEALTGAQAALVTTPWPQFRDLKPENFKNWMLRPLILDPGSHLKTIIGKDKEIIYLTVGKPL